MARTKARKKRPCVCFVVPQHMLAEIVQRTDDPVERRRAAASLSLSARLQGLRMGVSSLPSSLAARSPGSKYRMVYDGGTGTRLPGHLARREGQPATRDAAVDEAYDGAGVTADFLAQVFGRRSLDNKGMTLVATAHYGKGYDNAYWNGSEMVYGDGDGRLFHRFTRCLDVIAHELAHGMTQFCSNLEYDGEPGALNEHLSDVYGSMVKQWSLGHKGETADWLVGAGLFTPAVHGTALRSMLKPGTAYDDRVVGKDSQVGHYSQMGKADADDEGGVHAYSGIPNAAYALACAEAGGPAWEGVGRVWHEVASRRLWQDANFQDMADLTFNTARELFGDGSAVQKAILSGWREAGLKPK
jgi:Zn-dependent metalloprotease